MCSRRRQRTDQGRRARPVTFATVGLMRRDYDQYYRGFSNATLWPAFHYRADLLQYDRAEYEGYCRVNAWLAQQARAAAAARRRHLGPRLSPDSVRAGAARDGRHEPIGFFLHIPFPASRRFCSPCRRIENWSRRCVSYDLLGFQTGARRTARSATTSSAGERTSRHAATALSQAFGRKLKARRLSDRRLSRRDRRGWRKRAKAAATCRTCKRQLRRAQAR